jgi:CspA family cold shock protein
MTTGTIKCYSHRRGVGRVEPDDGTPDVLVTIGTIQRSGMGYVYEGQRVSYELMPSVAAEHAVFYLQAASTPMRQLKLQSSKKDDLRAVLFVDQVQLQRALARELGRLGFDVILPVTLDEARQALQPSLRAPDLLVTNLRNADGGTLDLLGIISQAEVKMPVVLIAEATDVSTARHRISMDGIVVLPTELDSFGSSVRRLCGSKMRGWSAAEHGNTMSAS